MNLMFTLDVNYIEPLKVCIKSIIRFPSDDGYNIFLLISENEDKFHKLKKEFESEYVRINILKVNEGIFNNFPETFKYSKVVYYRIFAASILPENMDRILYLDPDVTVIKPLNELYNMSFDGNYFIACSHTKEFLTKVNRIRLGIKNNVPYINTGVLFMNLKVLREKQNKEEVINYVKERGKAFILPDQDIITALYGDNVKIIDTLKYNLSDRMININNVNPLSENIIDMDWVKKNTVIIHYYGANKPWKEKYKGILDVFYREI